MKESIKTSKRLEWSLSSIHKNTAKEGEKMDKEVQSMINDTQPAFNAMMNDTKNLREKVEDVVNDLKKFREDLQENIQRNAADEAERRVNDPTMGSNQSNLPQYRPR